MQLFFKHKKIFISIEKWLSVLLREEGTALKTIQKRQSYKNTKNISHFWEYKGPCAHRQH